MRRDGARDRQVQDPRSQLHPATYFWLEAFRDKARTTAWTDIEEHSGLKRAELDAAGDVYAGAEKVIAVYSMGLTQHVHGSQSIQIMVNLMLMRSNIGKQGAGMNPVRGHSNVQEQRTVGISEKPD